MSSAAAAVQAINRKRLNNLSPYALTGIYFEHIYVPSSEFSSQYQDTEGQLAPIEAMNM